MSAAEMNGELSYLAFKALHAVYHERDFRVRVNDPTVNFVRRILAQCVGEEKLSLDALTEARKRSSCPACAAGFNFLDEGPSAEDRR